MTLTKIAAGVASALVLAALYCVLRGVRDGWQVAARRRELAEPQRHPRPAGRVGHALAELPPAAWTARQPAPAEPAPPARRVLVLLVTRRVRPQLDEVVAGQKWRNN